MLSVIICSTFYDLCLVPCLCPAHQGQIKFIQFILIVLTGKPSYSHEVNIHQRIDGRTLQDTEASTPGHAHRTPEASTPTGHHGVQPTPKDTPASNPHYRVL